MQYSIFNSLRISASHPMTTSAPFFDRIKASYNSHPWRNSLIILLLTLLTILGIARLMLSQTIIYSTTSWLKKQGINASIEAINFNIINGSISLINAKGYKKNTPLFNIGYADIYWRWAPLSKKTIVVTKIKLDNLNIQIKQYTNNIIIGGISIPINDNINTQKKPPSENFLAGKKIRPWAASLGEIILTNLNVCYLQHETTLQKASKKSLYFDYCLALKKMSWDGSINYTTDKKQLNTIDIPISSKGNITLNNLSITDNKLNKILLNSKSNTLDNIVISGLNHVKIDQLKMNDFSLLQREDKKHSDSVHFNQLAINDINIIDLSSITINTINIRKPDIHLIKNNPTDWEYQNWIPKSSLTIKNNKSKNNMSTAKTNPAFNLTFNNVDISESDLCYQENNTVTNYCLTFAELAWNGVVKYSTTALKPNDIGLLLKGDLKLTKQRIHNQTINRDLVDINTLTLSNLKVSGSKAISLKKINIKNLTALQRSKNKTDDTIAFDSLSINDLKYTPTKIVIDTIDLTDLTGVFSKNKNGEWEHNKWLPPKKTNKSTLTEIKEKNIKNKPTIISLNKFKLTSNKKFTFTDNSTQPLMNIGLQSIKVNLKDIDSSKPNAITKFNLYAKTIRHGTINLEGTAKPFAEKISFDANGELKGFDLRTASPATKKSIGHIIQSGQMDADLKLLAINGELDSNIKLSLYQFNIKANSKEDAEKLDAKFGMPLNQTLTLLRDKDDSIHLDIPVTGNVNNPNFNPMDAIIKATSKAATVTLITFYTPYGLIYAGGNLVFDFATALNFDPIDFKPGSAALLKKNKEQLADLSKLMTKKPNVHLTLCGVTNQQDTITLFPEFKNTLENKFDIKLTKNQTAKLEQLARDRQINTKNYLIKENGIKHDRLILCEPEYNTDNTIAGVKIII